MRSLLQLMKMPRMFYPRWRIAGAYFMDKPHLLEGCLSDFNKLIEKYPL